MSKANQKDQLKSHQFDGIQEYDNPVPLWMNVIYWSTIVFSLGYLLYYHVFLLGDLPHAELAKDITAAQELRAKTKAQSPGLDVAALLADPAAASAGQQTYVGMCAACHGPSGEGLVGPSFQDQIWKNGDGSLASIINIINHGVPDKGMPPWNMLGETVVNQVAAYIYKLGAPNGNGGPAPVEAASDVTAASAAITP